MPVKSNKKTTTKSGSETAKQAGQQVIFSLQAGTPIFVKTADICSAFGKTNQWIGELRKQGTIHTTQTNHGTLYNLFDTVRDYCKYLEDRSKKTSENLTEIELKKKAAEARFKEAKATVAEAEAEELQGNMHRSEDVAALTEDLIYNIRGALLALPGRLSAEVKDLTDQAEISVVIQNEIFAVMEQLSEYKYDSKKYEERVRARMAKEPLVSDEDD